MNNTPMFKILPSVSDYRKYYINKYCQKEIITFDNIKVKFYPDQFEHAFYESSNWQKANKDLFSVERAKRIDWIEYTLQNPNAKLYAGWDKKTKSYTNKRRAAFLTPEGYVVVVYFKNAKEAKFITAYYANHSAAKISNSPLWIA